MKATANEELTIEQLNNMLYVYKSKLENTAYALFIRPSAYEKIKDELNENLFYVIKQTDVMPDDKTQAIILTKKQYDEYFGEYFGGFN